MPDHNFGNVVFKTNALKSPFKAFGPELVLNGGMAAVTETNVYTSNFSAGTNGWTPQRGAVAGNIDAIDGQDNNLRFTTNNVNSSHYTTKTTGVMTVGNYYRVRLDYYIPSGQSNIDGIKARLGTVFSDIGNTTDAWASIDFYATLAMADAIQIWGFDGGASSWQDAGSDDVFYIRNVRIEVVTLTNWTGWIPQVVAGSLTGKALKVAGEASNLEQSTVVPIGSQIYRIIYTLDKLAGDGGDGITVELGSTDGTLRTANGTYDEDITTTDTDHLKFKATDGDADLSVTIDVVSVMKVN